MIVAALAGAFIPTLQARAASGAPPVPGTPALASTGPWSAAGLASLLWAIVLILGSALLLLVIRRLRARRSPAPARDVSGLPWWIWLFGGMAVLLAQGAGASLGEMAAARLALTDLPARTLVGTGGLLASGLAGAALIVLVARGLPAGGQRAGLRVGAGDLHVGAGCFLVVLPLLWGASIGAAWVHGAVTGSPPDPIAHDTLRQIREDWGDPWILLTVVLAIAGAPIVEEMVYRVFLQSMVLSITRRPWAAVLVTATLFALMHRAMPEPVPWHAIGVLWILGFGLGVAYERTGRLGVPIVMHALFNAGNIALAVLLR